MTITQGDIDTYIHMYIHKCIAIHMWKEIGFENFRVVILLYLECDVYVRKIKICLLNIRFANAETILIN